MLSTSIQTSLKDLGIDASHSQDFVSGLKLMQLVCSVFYEGEDKVLASKLRITQQPKTGINVLNINIILNHLKKDPNLYLPSQIKDLTAFRVIEEEDAMIQLVEWVLSQNQKKSEPSRLKEQMSPPREQENQFDNLYFVASLQKHEKLLNDSLDEESPRDKVVRKGSFKVLKPKLTSSSKQSIDENGSFSIEKRTENSVQKEPLRQWKGLDPNIVLADDKDDLQCRKTIPKMYERPPLYKSKQKQQKTILKPQEKKESPPEVTKRLPSQEELLQNIQSINKKILEGQKSLSLNVDDSKTQKRTRRSSRKIFKIEITEIQESKKKLIVEWLISINLLNTRSSKYIHQLHTICKDGVVFVEIMNYYRGRGKEICYFKEPKRSAEMNSNYQKLFSFLNQQIQFKSELLHQYQYFIPQAQQNSFWSLLSSMYHCFNKRVKPQQNNINRYENSISKKIERQTSIKKLENNSASYSQIKYNSTSLKKEPKTSCTSAEMPRKQTPKRNTQSNEHLPQKSILHYNLVQNQEPIEEINNQRTQRGYKEMYLCKFKNMQTPQKIRSFHNTSLSRSRLKLSVGSSKKKEIKPVIPSISLEMQMKVLQYLRTMNLQESNQQLFQDPYRNGVLICAIIKKSLGIDSTLSHRPKSIEDCRNNFSSAIQTLKSYKPNFNAHYENLIEDLIRGERALLYGLIWEAIKEEEKQCKSFDASLDLIPKGQNQQSFISWVRSVQRSYPQIGFYRIRSLQSLIRSITSTDFLFKYSWFITGKKAVTPTFQKPINDIQKQSNLKKSIGYLVQNKIVRSDYLWKTRSFVKQEQNILNEFISDLVNHYSHLHKKEQTKTVNFVRYLRREESESREKIFDKLETTMVNQTLAQPQNIITENPKIELPWMRKLGFSGPLELNNGVLLCKLIVKLTMKNINGIHENPQSRAECLGNIRKAIKHIPKFKWNQYDIFEGDFQRNIEIYSFIKDHFRYAYALKGI